MVQNMTITKLRMKKILKNITSTVRDFMKHIGIQKKTMSTIPSQPLLGLGSNLRK